MFGDSKSDGLRLIFDFSNGLSKVVLTNWASITMLHVMIKDLAQTCLVL
jgi:hypothetical protein